MYDNTGHLSLATRCYASMFPVEFNKDMSAVIGTERGKSAFEKYETGGVSGR